MKIVNKIVSIFLTVFVVIMFVIALSSVITSKTNYGVPRIGPYSVLVVKTDSMEPTLMTNTGIIIEKVDIANLKPKSDTYEGDIVTYYRRRDNAIITHRLIDIQYNESGNIYVFFGDNINASSCNGVCDASQKDYISGKYILGKVVSHSDALVHFYLFVTNRITQVFIVIIPVGYLIISAIVSKIKEKKEGSEVDE